MPNHKTGTREEWQAAREELLRREKEHTRMADELARQRRELPWVPVEKEYRFATDEGTRTLAQLFDGRSQLLIYHFMFGPSWEAGCPVCSSIADTINGVLPHLHARDVTTLLVSHAPLEKLQAYKRRMGWVVPWASSFDSDFNFDFDVSFTDQQVKEFMGPVRESGSLPSVSQNAASTGTDENGYLSEGPGASSPWRMASSTKLTLPTPAAWSSGWATTRSSTGCPKDATSALSTRSGSGDTTSTTASDACERLRPMSKRRELIQKEPTH
jgi:predicted dithiol-disulfide oxidoreductase (DUF899 family)